MAKHVCGSCRFFEQAREGKQGWCTHPERQESSAVRILVRAAELRCRDDWGHDKWEAQTASDEVLDVVMNEPSALRPPLTDRRYIPPTEPTIPVSIETAALSTAPLIPVIDFDEAERSPEPARPVSAELNRELLRRAHAQARERQRNKGYSVSEKRDDEPEALVISNHFIPPSREAKTPVSDRGTNSVFKFGGNDNDEAFDAVPDIDGSREVPRARMDRTSSKVRSRTDPTEERKQPVRAQQAHWVDDSVVDAPEPLTQSEMAEVDQWIDVDEFPEYSPSPVETLDDRFAEPEIEQDSWNVGRQIAKPPEAGGLWADIPRCCLTCRDFRPAGHGERGWCTNQWAFKHRRMVDAHDRPCETSIGHWWIPGDAVWQGDFDISALGQPTPLMDKWFGRSAGDEPTEVPLERRRRKTGSW